MENIRGIDSVSKSSEKSSHKSLFIIYSEFRMYVNPFRMEHLLEISRYSNVKLSFNEFGKYQEILQK